MEFRILGPLEVSERGRALAIGAGKQRMLLGILLLNAGELVSVDRLIEALWGERAPASAPNSVHIYVSQLRKELGADRVLTRGRGYALELGADDELDARTFEQRLEEGRRQRAAGDAARAAETLTEALGLWRGSALEDFRYDDFAQQAINRLEEQRLLAVEERVEAELELGRAEALVPELEGLVRAHPLRERIRGQLMLALYRSQRQAEALEVFQTGRRLLDGQLGLEPGPELRELERAILNHDPALDTPAATPLVVAVAMQRWPLLLAAAGAVLVLAAIAAIVLVATRGGRGAGLTSVAANALAEIDPQTNRIVAAVPVAGSPTRLEGVAQTVWIGSDDSGTVSALDRRTHTLTKLIATGFPTDLAVGEGAVWVVDGESGLLRKVDPAYGTVVSQLRLGVPNPVYDVSRESFDPTSIAAGAGSVWVTNGSRKLVRVEPATAEIVDRIDLDTAVDGVAAGADGVWAISGESATAIRLDRRGKVMVRIPIVSQPGFESPYPLQVAVGESYVWVLNGNTATLTKIDPEQRAVAATIPIGIDHGPVRLAVGEGAAWVANRDGTLARIDAETGDVKATQVARGLKDVTVAAGGVWVTTGSGLRAPPVVASNGSRPRVRALPTSFCSPMYYGGGHPQYLIASDLQLQGHGTTGAQLSQAIQYVLKQHGFRAGRYAVGYQSCDVSIAPSTFLSPEKCEANAHSYARNQSLIGVIGSFLSVCSEIELPILNRATNGPLAMTSFSNTYVGLTRSGPGTEPDEPGRYYPTGKRSYVRVIAAEDVQGAADAILGLQLHARRAYVLQGDFPGGRAVAAAFQSAATKLHIAIVGHEPLSAATTYKPLAARIKRLDADAVLIATFLDPSIAGLITDLREGLGPDVSLIAPDGFSDFTQLVKLEGAAAEGMTVSVPGVPNGRLGVSGRRFVAAFGREVGETPGPYAALAAQAAEVLLDAIARSNGTRASVTAELFKANIKSGILPDFSIDRNGDTTAGAVTIYRLEHGLPRVFKVITPPPGLVR
jgi:DNA-binding SARP family transcriptional activator/outer membrane protein assembly factor BamB